MEPNSLIIVALAAGVLIGALLVHLIHRRSSGINRDRAEQLALEVEETRAELEANRDDVSRHFEQTSELFHDLTQQYSRLYSHLAEGAREFSNGGISELGRGFQNPLLGEKGGAGAPSVELPLTSAQPATSAEPAASVTPPAKDEMAAERQQADDEPRPKQGNGSATSTSAETPFPTAPPPV